MAGSNQTEPTPEHYCMTLGEWSSAIGYDPETKTYRRSDEDDRDRAQPGAHPAPHHGTERYTTDRG